MSWKKMRLGKFLEVRKGKFKPSHPAIAELKRVDKIDFSGQIHLSGKSSNTDMILIKKGDLLISGINVAKGAVTVYEGDDDIVATVHYSSYVYDADQIDITFLKLFLQSPEFFDAIREQIPGGIKTEIKPKHLLPLEVVIPSTLDEQKEVAALYFEFQAKQNALDSELNQQLAYLAQLRQALLREAMQGQLLPQDPTDEPAAVLLQQLQAAAKPGKKGRNQAGALFAEEAEAVEGPFEIPASWAWTTLGGVSDVVRGGSPRPAGDKRYYEGNIPFLKVADLTATDSMYLSTHTHTIKEAGLNRTRSVEANTLMLTNSGATLGIPKICTFPTTFNDGVAAFLNIDTNINKQYLYYFLKLKSSWFLEEASRGQGQPNLNTDIIKNVSLPLPPSAEQHRIVAKLAQLLQHCDDLEQRIRESRRLAEQLLATALREALAPPASTAIAAAPEAPITAEPVAPRRRGRPPRQPATEAELTDLFSQPF